MDKLHEFRSDKEELEKQLQRLVYDFEHKYKVQISKITFSQTAGAKFNHTNSVDIKVTL